jgi:hypothetical protein
MIIFNILPRYIQIITFELLVEIALNYDYVMKCKDLIIFYVEDELNMPFYYICIMKSVNQFKTVT